MASFLVDFTARIATYVEELERLQARNSQKHAFRATFWMENTDFTLARDVFVAASGTIGQQVTKFSLVLSKTPSREEGESICQALDEPCEKLLTAAKVALFCGAGPSLAEEILSDALRLTKSVLDLGKAIEHGELAKVPQLTGRVWEYSVSRVSKSNCVASKRSMLQCISMLNSTVEELQEFLDEQGDATSEQALDAVELDDEFAFDSSLSDEEKALFQAGLKLLKMSAGILKRGVLAVKKLASVADQEAFLAWTSKLEAQYSSVQDVVVDFGAAMYPPVGVEELSASVESLEATGSGVLSTLLAQPELSDADAGQLAAGQTAFAKQVAAVKEQLEVSQ